MKPACAQISSVCGVTVETSTKALQIVCKDLYNHVYLLSKEHAENEGVNKTSSKYDNHVVPSVIRLPSSNGCKLQKTEAAFALFNKTTLVKSIVHFDTTGRSSIDREWPSLILKFSDRTEYTLWPIFFAFED